LYLHWIRNFLHWKKPWYFIGVYKIKGYNRRSLMYTNLCFLFQAKIVDSDGHVLPVNTPGEICFRGYCVMLGYWEDKEKTDACIEASGWFHSG